MITATYGKTRDYCNTTFFEMGSSQKRIYYPFSRLRKKYTQNIVQYGLGHQPPDIGKGKMAAAELSVLRERVVPEGTLRD
jgi:hypothetical protein